MNTAGLEVSDQTLDALLHWLEREPADDPGADLALLRQWLHALPLSAWSLGKGLLALKGAGELGQDIAERVRARLHESSLPLEQGLQQGATGVAQLLFEIAARVAAALPTAGHQLRAWRSEREHCLLLCAEALLTAAMAANTPPPGLWQLAHSLAAIDGDSPVYSIMLALAAAAPEGATPRELVWLVDFLAETGQVLPPLRRVSETRAVWWVEPGLDQGPLSLSLNPPASDAEVSCFDFLPLIEGLAPRLRSLQEALEQSAAAVDKVDIELLEVDDELPPGLAPAELLRYLRALRERWLGMAQRSQPRRPSQRRLGLCIGLRRMWELASGEPAATRVSRWTLLNESAGGFSIAHDGSLPDEALSEVIVGTVVGLRFQSEQPWMVCAVRWVRSSEETGLELGLQLLAPHYQAVRLAFRGDSLRGVTPALALPAMEPLRRQRALLAAAGSCRSRRFVLMRDGHRLYVTQARVLGIDLQTASFELFRYEIDPNPI